jgi:hypothetical protein
MVVVQMPRAAVWILAVAVLVPWVWIFFGSTPIHSGSLGRLTGARATSSAPEGGIKICNPGRWGELEYIRILIEPPEEFVRGNYEAPQQIRWFFKGFSPDALRHLLQSSGLTPLQFHELSDPARWETTPDGIWVKPSKETILQMSSDARARLYTVLAAFAENPAQNEPFRFRADAVEDWFEDSGLSEQTIALVKRLVYRRGSTLCFSDHDVVLPMIGTPQERSRLVKTLARKSTLLLKLRVRSDSDIEALSQYWGKGFRSKDVRPLLQSVAHRKGGVTVDVAHLVPKFARSLLYTYPLPSEDLANQNQDCHWTSLNFFSDQPDNRYSNIEVVRQTLRDQYHPVPGDMELGDILLLVNCNGVVIHSCVYIADNIVFTKNGASFAMPWLLMTLEDLLAFYPSDPPLEIRRYRLNRF